MTVYSKLFRKKPRGFSLIDLLASMLIASILLVGVYKTFLSNIRQSSQMLDTTLLDEKTKRVVKMLQNDIFELNGNIIKGVPTIFPLFRFNDIKGFVLFKADKALPILNMPDGTSFTSPNATQTTVTLKSKNLNKIDSTRIKPGMIALLYNYENYSFVPHRIDSATPVVGETNAVTLTLSKFFGLPEGWQSYLKTEPCTDNFQYISGGTNQTSVCVDNAYQSYNSIFIILESVEYFVDSDTLYRQLNSDPTRKMLLANNVTIFEPSFGMKENTLYPQEKVIIEDRPDIETYIRKIIPGNAYNTDDCNLALNYKCIKNDGVNINEVGYAYFANNVSSINIKLKMLNESEKSQTFEFMLTLDDNIGNTALTTFAPTKIIAKKNDSLKPLGSQTAIPSFNGVDPMGGDIGLYYTAIAPMKDPVLHPIDPAAKEELRTLCEECNLAGNCQEGGYPEPCYRENKETGTKDWTFCVNSNDPQVLYEARCPSAQGSPNDVNLESDPNPTINNQVNSKIALLDGMGNIRQEYDLSRNCSGPGCVLDDIYWNQQFDASSTYRQKADSLNPMAAYTYVNPDTGEPEKFYVGMWRTRWPWMNRTDLNFEQYYHSQVLAIDPKGTREADDDTATWIHTLQQNLPNPMDPRYEIAWGRDIDGVSELDIRREEGTGREYMYLTSTSGNRVAYRWRPDTSSDDVGPNGWSDIEVAFDDTEEKYPVKFSMFVPAPDGSKHLAVYPFYNMWEIAPPTAEFPRIAAMSASKNTDDIVYCTAQATRDLEIDGSGYFYQNEIRYSMPIVYEDGTRYTCSANHSEFIAEEDWNDRPECVLPANTPKPIDWRLCNSIPSCMNAEKPRTESIREDYSAALKVAKKLEDGNWKIYKVADLHGQCTGIEQSSSGDIFVSSPLNIKKFSYESVNELMADIETFGKDNVPIQKIDLAKKSGGFYAANNNLSSYASLDPPSPDSNLDLKKIAGIKIFDHNNRINLVFTDAYSKMVGYIYQERNPYRDMLFTQIVRNESGETHDANLDEVAVFSKGLVDRGEKFTQTMLPWNTDKVWGNWETYDGVTALDPTAPPIQVRAPRKVMDYVFPLDSEYGDVESTQHGGHFKRMLEYSDRTQCIYNPADPIVCPVDPLTGETVCQAYRPNCGQSLYFHSCDADAYAGVNQGVQAGQPGFFGCGLPYPNFDEDPSILPPPPSPTPKETIVPIEM